MNHSPIDDPFTRRAADRGEEALARARLMDAAAEPFAAQDLSAPSLDDIAARAGLDGASARACFADVETLFRAVAAEVATAISAQVEEATLEIDDAAQRIALSTRRFVELAAERPAWGRVLFRAYWALPDLRAQLQAGLRADIERGVAHGMFHAANVDAPFVGPLAAMTLAALQARLDSESPDVACRAAELQLRALGLAPAAAEAVAWKVLPQAGLSARFL